MYRCLGCRASFPRYTPACPHCGEPATLMREAEADADELDPDPSVPLATVVAPTVTRLLTGVRALDRVLGGGAALGSAILIGGAEGAGKSTLLLQACAGLAHEVPTLFVAAEQAPSEVRSYADRVGLVLPRTLRILQEPTLAALDLAVARHDPVAIAVDSLNTVSEDEGGTPGSPREMLACIARLAKLAKDGRAVFIVAHLNNENRVAGSRRVRYLVDVVLKFEPEQNGSPMRRLSVENKNRFGVGNAVERLEMTATGLR